MVNKTIKLQKYSAPALEKGLDILEFLSVQDNALTLSQIASGIDRSKSEIFRMMIVLEERGYIARNGGDQFYLTEKLGVLGARQPASDRLAEIATPILSDLASRTAHSCHLSVIRDAQICVIAHSMTPVNYGISVNLGHRQQVYNSSAGTCLLAFMSPQEQSAYLRDAAKQERSFDREAFARFVLECREKNFVTLPNPEVSEIKEISAPVFGVDADNAVAALTMPYVRHPAHAPSLRDVTAEILKSAKEIRTRIKTLTPSR